MSAVAGLINKVEAIAVVSSNSSNRNKNKYFNNNSIMVRVLLVKVDRMPEKQCLYSIRIDTVPGNLLRHHLQQPGLGELPACRICKKYVKLLVLHLHVRLSVLLIVFVTIAQLYIKKSCLYL